MEQLEFKFKFSAEAEAKKLLEQINSRRSNHGITLERIINLIEHFAEKGHKLTCDVHGFLYTRWGE